MGAHNAELFVECLVAYALVVFGLSLERRERNGFIYFSPKIGVFINNNSTHSLKNVYQLVTINRVKLLSRPTLQSK